MKTQRASRVNVLQSPLSPNLTSELIFPGQKKGKGIVLCFTCVCVERLLQLPLRLYRLLLLLLRKLLPCLWLLEAELELAKARLFELVLD